MIARLCLSLSLVVFMAACATVPRGGPVSLQALKDRAADYEVEILRDTWGVPHILGESDVDVAFGLAYAHAEDDYATIEDALITARGIGAAFKGKDAAAIDYMVHLLGVWDFVNAKYDTDLSPETRAICEAYADGLNYYAAMYPDKLISKRILPFTGQDVIAGFVFRGPFFYGLDSAVGELFGSERRRPVSTKTAGLTGDSLLEGMDALRAWMSGGEHFGSNTFAIAPSRTADGSTMLNVNSHQPWTGPVAWYEAHVRSGDGWEAVGGVFPGTPVILHGHNRRLGWAHTVNRPDLVDIYVLDINPENPNQYRFDGQWLDFERDTAHIVVKLFGNFRVRVAREVLRSLHGPVVRQEHGVYAIRYAGRGDIRQVEQWYRMNKAETMDEWLEAMRMRAVPSLNSGYADADGNILYLYNALLPIRAEGYDWRQYLPGDTSETLWAEYLPFDDMPMVINPPSGFIQNCNASPFTATVGEGNPDPAAYSPAFGIETHETNRSMRALQLLGADNAITWEAFKAYKFDMAYHAESFVGKSIAALRDAPEQADPIAHEAVQVVKGWDLDAHPESRAAALAILALQPLYRGAEGDAPPLDRLIPALTQAAERLKAVHGRIDVPWGDVNRLRRGNVDLGLGGGPDILRAISGRVTEDGAHIEAHSGDCYVLLVRWDADGKVHSESIHQFGSATLDAASPHYADQAPLFANHELKPVWLDEADIRQNLSRAYRPGAE